MSNELVINGSHQETRVALLEDGTVVEIYIERQRDRSILGNLYRGRVVNVLPGIQAAFVDIGMDRAAFLYVADADTRVRDYQHIMEDGWEERNGLEFETTPPRVAEHRPIEEVVREGQELLVQVSREPLGTKGTRVTAHVTLPGRHLVLMPTVNHVGVSRRIIDPEERHRLRETILKMKPPGLGFIARTASEGADSADLEHDMDLLIRMWENTQRRYQGARAPSLIHGDLSIVLKALRDLLTVDVSRIVTDSQEAHEQITQFVQTYTPRLHCQVDFYEGQAPIFDVHGIENELDRALKRKVWLKSGGYIIIEMTEALTAVDVNTGKFVGKRNLEDTILKTNLEAAREIAYQIRLRDIGGIIIIDFIDMEKESDREMVFHTLGLALKKDRVKSTILKISELGLVEMTRKRTRESLSRFLGEPCSCCDGLGYVKSRTTVCHEIFRQIERVSSDIGGDTILVDAHPEVAEFLCDEERTNIESLEKRLKKRIVVQGKDRFQQEQFEIVAL